MKTTSLSLLLFLVLTGSITAEKITLTTTVYFNTTEHSLTNQAKNELQQFFNEIKENPDFEITIEGHTDNRGSIAYNDELSMKRSLSVKSFFIENGIPEKYIKIKYEGELKPAVPNVSAKNMENNRRVEVSLNLYQFNNLQELEQELGASSPQKFIIEPSVENVLQGKKGVKLYLPAGSFALKNGEIVTEEVELEMTEALTMEDFIASGLETKAGEELLETGGMVKLQAKTISGNEVIITEGKNLTIAVPNKNRKNDMEVFLSESGSDWTATGNAIRREFNKQSYPPYPEFKFKSLPFPKFTYHVPEPKSPRKPGKPSEPHEPREQSYKRHIPWYSLNKEKLREKQVNNYEKAVERYEKRVDLYEKREQAYQTKMAKFNQLQCDYRDQLAEWHKNKQVAIENFRSTAEYQRVLEKNAALKQIYLEKHREEVKKWREQKRTLAVKWGENMDKMGITDKEALDNYVFTVNTLSWINVDRFRKMDAGEKQDILVKAVEVGDEKVMVLFKSINSLIACQANESDNTYSLNNIPLNEEAYLLAYKVVDKKPMICFEPLDGSKEYKLNYQAGSFTEIKEILAQFKNS